MKVVLTMDKQYASALFDIVKEDKTLNEAKESFDVFVDVLKTNLDFWNVLNSPKITNMVCPQRNARN